jgi:hypothetical protein
MTYIQIVLKKLNGLATSNNLLFPPLVLTPLMSEMAFFSSFPFSTFPFLPFFPLNLVPPAFRNDQQTFRNDGKLLKVTPLQIGALKLRGQKEEKKAISDINGVRLRTRDGKSNFFKVANPLKQSIPF